MSDEDARFARVWANLASCRDPEVSHIARRLASEPLVTRFYPYTSHSAVCLSRNTEYPWRGRGLPTILPLGDAQYAVVELNAGLEVVGDLEAVVRAAIDFLAPLPTAEPPPTPPSIDLDLTFPQDYSCDVVDEIPSGARCFTFSRDAATERGSVKVRVTPETGQPWYGIFTYDDYSETFSRVVSLPDPSMLCVIAGGVAYGVRTAEPERWDLLRPLLPILASVSARDAGLVIFASARDLVAHDANGQRWCTARIHDRLIDGIHSVTSSSVIVRCRSYDGKLQSTFDVDLISGSESQ